MKLGFVLTFVFGMVLSFSAGAASSHPCSSDAFSKAEGLLKKHIEDPNPPHLFIEDTVTYVGTVKALVGRGRFDVLQVWGVNYKARYRMHFLYAQIPGTCALMGQEILEASDPY